MPEPATITIVCLGATDRGLRALLHDVFDDMGLRLHFAPLWHRSPDLVLVAVQRRDLELMLAAACEVAEAAPILAILPYSDERLARLAHERGAHACYALDTPLAALRAAVGSLSPVVAARRAAVSHG